MQTAAQVKPRRCVSRVAADKRFKGYKPETAKAVRTPKVKEDATLGQLRSAWEIHRLYKESQGLYPAAIDQIKGISYSAEDVRNFCIVLAEFQNEEGFSWKAGVFLSALINNGRDEEYTIQTKHLSIRIDMLGMQNTKNITVEGSVDYKIGELMQSGRIVVKGNAGDYVGSEMSGGTIIIEGNVEYGVGEYMKGGVIIVQRDCDDAAGVDMEGGEIHLHGKYKLSDYIKGGQIFHRGVQIYPKTGAN